ncbi:hypothetical protein KW795_00935 [Candidatus Microgenomates bacterium]|nr:hypothetical protein [Candidatus Microgenomates bacterium]
MRNKGNASLLILIFVAFVLIVGAAAGSYYILQSQGKAPAVATSLTDYYKPGASLIPSSSSTPAPSGAAVSDNTDTKTLDTELNNTSTGSVDSDVNNLNSSASSL